MGYEKHKRPLTAPSFTPNPSGIALADLEQGTDGQVPVAQTSGATTYRSLSGDVTIDSTGVATVAPTVIKTATVSITNAQIKALRASPKTLVAAQGTNKLTQFISAILVNSGGSNALTESADNMAIKYNDGSGLAVSQTIEATGFVDQTAKTVTNALPAADAIVASATAANKALVLHNTGDGEYGGNAAADVTWTVYITYRVLSI